MDEETGDEVLADLNDIIQLLRTKNVEELYESYELGHGNQINEKDDSTMENQSTNGCDTLLFISTNDFSTREELLSNVREIVFEQGFVTKIKKSKTDCYVIIGCDRGGKYQSKKPPEEKKRKVTGSRLIDCPFEVWGKRKGDGVWKLDIKNLSHNHEASRDMSGHPYCRRFSNEEIQRIQEMTRAGIPPRQILTSLRQSNSNLQAISRTLYNVRAKIKRESLNGSSNIQALFEEFGQSNFIYDIERDEKGHLTHLFFAHPLSIKITKTYSNVFVMDCTYKTNKFKMPLLDVVGMNSFNGSFYSCFAFLPKEEESDYIWALKRFNEILDGIQPQVIVSDRELALMNAIKVGFPNTGNLLCIWHIEKNILAKCKGFFDDKEGWDTFISTWTNLIQSPDQSSFEQNMNSFEAQYIEKKSLLNYINTTWIPYKERFVFAWTNNFMHLGNHASSRAEGAHAVLKQYLNVSTGDFRDVKDKISLAIENQYQEIKARVASEKVRVPHKFRIPLFRELVCRISVFSLSQLYKQYELATTPGALIDTCKSHFSNSMGLPCAHKIKKLSKEGVLHLSDIHPQWRIDTKSFIGSINSLNHRNDDIDVLLKEFQDKYQKLPLVQKEDSIRQITQFLDAAPPVTLEPEMVPHKGRPIGSKNKKNKSSTTRDPSAFEVHDMRKCSKCQGTGHNSRTCPGKMQGI